MAYFELRPTCASPDYPIYGAEWAGTSDPSWTRTDAASSFSDPNPYYAGMTGTPSSPFDNISPWKDLVVSEDSEAGKLVSIPKFYYKWTRSGSTMKLQISMSQHTGFLVSPAHADRGDGQGERDVVYVARYHCAISTYKSTSGVVPQTGKTRAEFRTAIHSLGNTVWQYDFAMFWTITMLYLVEYANWNSQATIGGGGSATSATSSSKFNMGSTDNMPYHTGNVGNSHSSYGAMQYRNIEGLWDNVVDSCDGIYFAGTSNKDVYVIKNPADFSDTTGGTKVSERPTTSGFSSKWSTPSASGYEYALFPTELNGTDSTYVCDRCAIGGTVLLVGSYYGSHSQNEGAFCFYANNDAGAKNDLNWGSRLMKLP